MDSGKDYDPNSNRFYGGFHHDKDKLIDACGVSAGDMDKIAAAFARDFVRCSDIAKFIEATERRVMQDPAAFVRPLLIWLATMMRGAGAGVGNAQMITLTEADIKALRIKAIGCDGECDACDEDKKAKFHGGGDAE